MGVEKNATYKVHNGTDFDEINFKTIASQVKTSDGSNVEISLSNKINKSDFIKGGTDANGWQKNLVTGEIEVWGNAIVYSTNTEIYFPLGFSEAVQVPILQLGDSSANVISYLSCTNTKMIVKSNLGGCTVFFRVKGR